MSNSTGAVRTNDFIGSIGINTHMSYTDGAYADEANVAADLSYLGITKIRDGVPNPNGGVPSLNQITSLEALGADGIQYDLVTSPNQISVSQTIQEIENLDMANPGSVIAVEGANEINNQPVTYNGLTGQAAATAFQEALYSAIKSNSGTSSISVYAFTGGLTSPLAAGGSAPATENSDGSYTLSDGQIGFPVTLPTGISTITMDYTAGSSGNTPASGVFGYPGAGQQSGINYGTNGIISYTYDNTSGTPAQLYVDFIDYNETDTLTNVSVTAQDSTTNLVTFDPNLSLSGQADYANIHPYAGSGGPVAPLIPINYENAFGSTNPGPRVITETGYQTDTNDSNGVSQLVQAQQEVSSLLDAYQSGVSTTYLYELLDEKSDPSNSDTEFHYGVFNFDNTPKLAATAIHDLTSILSDTGAAASSFTAGSLNYTESGNTSSDNSMLMEKSNGIFDLALWNDADAGTSSFDNITVSLSQTYSTVETYDVVTDATTIDHNVSQVNVTVGGDDMIVEVDPNTSVACFASGTRITTPSGLVNVEDIKAGDIVLDARDGAERPVIWVGRRTIDLHRHPRSNAVRPIVITANAFSQGIPLRNLVLSPDHALYFSGNLIESKYLVNGATVFRDNSRCLVTYYHIECDQHAVILAEGVPAETYMDCSNRNAFENQGSVILHPDFTSTHRQNAAGKLIIDGPTLIDIRQKLLDRALASGFDMTSDIDLVVKSGKDIIQAHFGMSHHLDFYLPVGTKTIFLSSSTGVPSELLSDSTDSRRLGVAIGGMSLMIDGRSIEINLKDQQHKGFYEMEPGHRWTNGEACVELPDHAGNAMLRVRLHGQATRWKGHKSAKTSTCA